MDGSLARVVEQTDIFGGTQAVATEVDREGLSRMLASALQRMTVEQVARLVCNEFTEIVEYAALCAGERACQRTSLLFNPHRLDCGADYQPISFYRALQEKNFCMGLARALLWRKDAHVSDVLWQLIGLGVNGCPHVDEFPPTVARELAQDYGLSRRSLVLDPCAGWGGRMLGFSTVVDTYMAFEPSTRTHAGLEKLAQWIKRFRPQFVAEVLCVPFEDAHLSDGVFDFAFTSPPYYSTEHYADEPTQSRLRYATFGAWCDGFYAPLIANTMAALKPGAAFVLNIGSRKFPLSKVLKDRFGERYSIRKIGGKLSAWQLGEDVEGETFYEIRQI